jgi:hypothetical protein
MTWVLHMIHPLLSGNGGKFLCTITTATRWRLAISFCPRTLTPQEWPSLGIGASVAVMCVPSICVKYLNHILDWLLCSEFWYLPLSSAKYQASTLKLVTTTFAHIPPKFVATNHLIPYLMLHNLSKYENKHSSWHINVGILQILRSSLWCNWEFCNSASQGEWFPQFQRNVFFKG